MNKIYLIFALLITISTLQAKGTKQKREEQLFENVTRHLSRISDEITSIQSQLQSTIPYNLPVAITAVPFTISSPGSYYVAEDLTYSGSDAAITVNADNVTINFYNNTLYVTNPDAAGILVQNAHEFTLVNSILEGSTKAVALSSCIGASIQNSFLNNSSIVSSGSTSVSIIECSFQGMDTAPSTALVLEQNSSHITIEGCTFSNWQNSITATDVSLLQIDNSIIAGSETAIGNPLLLTNTNNTQISNSFFTGSGELLFASGSGVILDTVSIEISDQTALHIGSGSALFDKLLAKNCLFMSTGEYALYIENGSNIHCINCQFSGATSAGIQLESASGCLFTHCKISDTVGTGISITSGSSANTIIDCEISNNGQNGVVIAEHALYNQLINNNIYDNGNYGISNSEPTSAVFSNVSCNNATADCPSGVSPVQAPGVSPLVPGSNICCIP